MAASIAAGNSAKHGLGWNVVEGDVKDIDFSEYEASVIQAGFPCQAFSHAGKSRGFEDTRGTLFFDFARAIRDVRPKIAIGENVRGLVKHDGGKPAARNPGRDIPVRGLSLRRVAVRTSNFTFFKLS